MDCNWHRDLQRLVDAGAELVVTDPDGTVVVTAPLARVWRVDADDPDCVWLRPLPPPVTDDDGTTVFALSQCRRRALLISDVEQAGGALAFALRIGQRARIQPATGAAARTLDAWDTFVGTRLDAAEELALDALEDDSWTGRYA